MHYNSKIANRGVTEMRYGTTANLSRTLAVAVVAFTVIGFACVAMAQPAAAPGPATFTLQLENDSTRPGSDSYYTSGGRIAYTSAPDHVPAFMANLGDAVLGPARRRWLGLEVSHTIYTPYFSAGRDTLHNDRPYAAVVMGTVSLIQDVDNHRTSLGLGLGIIGPAAFGEAVQNGFHNLINQSELHGWGTQIPNQPVIQLTAERTWRLALKAANAGGWEVDVLPSATVGAGTFRIYGQAGAQVRLGQGLAVDFGVPRIRPGLTGSDAYDSSADFAWYVFLGADGQAVAWDETLDGLPFARSRNVGRIPLVGELQGGLAIISHGWRFTAAHVLQTNEFRGQRNGLFQFSSASLSVPF